MRRRTKAQIEQERSQLEELIRVTRRTRAELLKQEAAHAYLPPPHVLHGLDEATARIEKYEAELAQLNIRAVEEDVSLEEAEYRAAVAEAWETAELMPTTGKLERLQVLRLRSGITQERAMELEQDIRASFARDSLATINLNHLTMPDWVYGNEAMQAKQEAVLDLLDRATLANPNVTAELLTRHCQHLLANVPLDPVRAPSGFTSGKQPILNFLVTVHSVLSDRHFAYLEMHHEQYAQLGQAITLFATDIVESMYQDAIATQDVVVRVNRLDEVSRNFQNINRIERAITCAEQSLETRLQHPQIFPYRNYGDLASLYRLYGNEAKAVEFEAWANKPRAEQEWDTSQMG